MTPSIILILISFIIILLKKRIRTDLNKVRLTLKNPPRLICEGFISVALRNMFTSVWASVFIHDNSTISSFFWKLVRTWDHTEKIDKFS